MSRLILFTIIVVFLSGCTNNVAKRTVDEYNEMFERVMSLEKQMSQTDFQALSASEIVELNEVGKELYYDYNPMDLTPEQVSLCEALKERVNKLRNHIITLTANEIDNFKVTSQHYDELLLSQPQAFPVYL